MHVLQTTPEQHDLGLEIVRDQLLPWLRDSSGFRGLIRLASPSAGKKLGELTTETVGGTRLALEDYEVTLFDVSES